MRFRSRHVHKTICTYVEDQLTTKGWVNDPVNFGATAVTFEEIQPDENGLAVEPNTVAITLGDAPAAELEELGDGLWSIPYVVFIDVYGDNGSVAVSIAEDIRDSIDRDKCVYVSDFTDPNNPVVTTNYVQFERVVGPERPPASASSQDFRRYWRIVKATARLYYSPED